jgi:hypothetical protein
MLPQISSLTEEVREPRTPELTAMGTEELLQGHVLDFETGICTRCGMSEIEFEKLGEPQCSGKKPETPVVTPRDE